MTELLNQAYNPENYRDTAHKLVDLLTDHLQNCLNGDEKQVLPWEEPEVKLKNWQARLHSDMDSIDFWNKTIGDTIHLHHPKYMGHQVSPVIPLSGMGDLINGTLNNGSAIFEMGPVTSVMEKIVLDWLASAIGYTSDARGILTSGGSLGNLTALLAARQIKSGYNHWNEGIRKGFCPAAMASEESHYSVARAVKIMGWGEQGIVKVPINKQLQMDPEGLEISLQRAKQEGRQVLVLVANACSTSTGTYDSLNQMADFCEKHNIWLHVDGAHGGAAAITSKYKHLTNGLSRADSVVIDFHKMMGVSALTTAVLFKNGKNSYATFNQEASYLLNADGDDPWYDSALRTIECTKNMMAIKVYSILKTYGAQIFIDYLTSCYDLGKLFGQIIQEQSDFELALEPSSNIVCFRYIVRGKSEKQLNEHNFEIREKLKREGKFYIVQTTIGSKLYLRTALMNPFTSSEELTGLLEEIRLIS